MLADKAKQFAQHWHANQQDKAGKPYFLHLEFVAKFVADQSDEVIATAWLHDIVEDTVITIEQIEQLFGKVVAQAVEAITKRQGEDYQAYLERIKKNGIARKVKIADLTHNMDLSRLPHINEKDLARAEKYRNAYRFLTT
ncbi:guanosine-3',5'-bis(diphosphate) 3'-pyrophosphohydrolase [Haemophilus paracuniculus]|uniref:Guanosine-3',5'-bis(Diphosphate) 3'-pyrophosphohydrolase n=1 Tax=Haemophilus paracuniculus TaxID=734 RepID=A0A1T0ASM8_9PAST|nr:HD domain-containing protein [Haemophilus paracuniculus]OOR99291.1 guanosine-3',5'-bis(diphosphate) 3'-pyrophosphohydrolase [Haemophilus paracuniculus]